MPAFVIEAETRPFNEARAEDIVDLLAHMHPAITCNAGREPAIITLTVDAPTLAVAVAKCLRALSVLVTVLRVHGELEAQRNGLLGLERESVNKSA